eukprot:747664-Hanusia_phi.AAC.5
MVVKLRNQHDNDRRPVLVLIDLLPAVQLCPPLLLSASSFALSLLLTTTSTTTSSALISSSFTSFLGLSPCHPNQQRRRSRRSRKKEVYLCLPAWRGQTSRRRTRPTSSSWQQLKMRSSRLGRRTRRTRMLVVTGKEQVCGGEVRAERLREQSDQHDQARLLPLDPHVRPVLATVSW